MFSIHSTNYVELVYGGFSCGLIQVALAPFKAISLSMPENRPLKHNVDVKVRSVSESEKPQTTMS